MSTNSAHIEDEAATMLLTRIGNGDSKAMEMFYRTFSRTVYAFVLRRLKSPAEAEEVVVETMYQVWRNAGSFEGRSRPRTWLLGIAQYRLLDKLRGANSHSFETMGDEVANVESEEMSAFERLAQRQTAEQIRICLAELPNEQRECIYLAFYEELTVAEIAEIQGCPTNTVKTRLFHARRKLKLYLERQTRWQLKA